MVKRLSLLLIMSILASIAPVAIAQENVPRPTSSAAASAKEPPSVFAQPHRTRKPIPLQWKLAIAGSAIAFSAALLFFASRRWRTWNLFDRQYYFPIPTDVALRLGATKSGGCLATTLYARERTSAPEDL